MSDSENEGFEGLFGGEEDVKAEFKRFEVDRSDWLKSGITSPGFLPKWDVATSSHLVPFLAPLVLFETGKHHSLWGHRIWNAAMYLSKLMDTGVVQVRNRSVLELGAGLGVPALVAHQNGARVVVTTDYPDEALLSVLRMNVEANKIEGKEGERDGPGSLHAMPLLWGNSEHMQACLERNQTGQLFDVIILSDIVFNHVCHDDLLKTVAVMMARDSRAAAYCAFSHHRPYKRDDDMKFFEKCKNYGLQWEKVDEEIYPLMFPDDPGPAEIRAPVHCFRLTHRFDACGPPVEYSHSYDCVVQGTGLTECLVSAALSRQGLRVLHLDKFDSYGGVFNTLEPQGFLKFIESRFTTVETDIDELSTLPMNVQRRFQLDTLPMVFVSRSDLIAKLAANDMAKNVEFQNVDAVVRCVVDPKSLELKIKAAPMTRADIFASKAFAPMEMRRVMRFVRDVEARLAEDEHAAAVANDRTECKEFAGTFRDYLKATYSLADETVDALTLHGAIRGVASEKDDALIDVEHTIEWMRTYLTSIGYYDGQTPFLSVNYGCAELPQNMARVSAVWNGMFVLGRYATETCRTDRKAYVTLSNDQRLETKAVIVAEQTQRIVRYLVITNEPIFDWTELQNALPSLSAHSDDLPRQSVPIVMAVGTINAESIVMYQQSYSTSQAPADERYSILHAVSYGEGVSQQELAAFMNRLVDSRSSESRKTLLRTTFTIAPGDGIADVRVNPSMMDKTEDVAQDHIFTVPSTLRGIDDGAYLRTAEDVFQKVVKHCQSMGVDPWSNCPFPGTKRGGEAATEPHTAVPFLPPMPAVEEDNDDLATVNP